MRNAKDIDLTETAATAADTPVSDSPTRAPTPGEVAASRYSLGDEVGRGGIGRVLRAHDKNLEREIAVKELLEPTVTAEARFFREAKITARLQHPGIVPIYETGRWPNGDPFYAMKMVLGKSLKELIDEAETLDERLTLVPNVLAVADAVAYAHNKGVIHRDLKPSNIIVGEFGETLVIDWGLARETRHTEHVEKAPYRTAQNLSVTRTGAVLGTAGYMPPEQARGEQLDERADVFAIGATLFALLTQEPPNRDRGDVWTTLRLPKEVHPELAAIVTKSLAASPSSRYSSAQDLSEDLRRYLAGAHVSVYRYSSRELLQRWLSRNKRVVATALVALVAMAAFGAIAITRIISEKRRTEEQRAVALQSLTTVRSERDRQVLRQAANALARDPTMAAAHLKLYEGAESETLRNLAADILARPLASQLVAPHRRPVMQLQLLPSGDVLSASNDRTLRLWPKRSSATEVLATQLSELALFDTLAEHGVVFTAGSGQLLVLDLNTKNLRSLATSDSTVLALAANHQRNGAWAVTSDGRVIRASNGAFQQRKTFDSPDFAAVSRNGNAVACDGGSLVFAVAGSAPSIGGACYGTVSISEDGLVAAGGTAHHLGLFSAQTDSWTHWTAPHDLYHTELSDDGRLLVIGSEAGHVSLRGTGNLAESTWSLVIGTAVTATTFIGNEGSLAVGTADGEVWVVDRHGVSTRYPGHDARITYLSSDGSQLVSGSLDGSIRRWPLRKASSVVLFSSSLPLYHARFSPSRELIAFESMSGEVRVGTVTGDNVTTLGRHKDLAFGLSWRDDGAAFATGSRDGTARIWSLSGEPEVVLRGHASTVRAVVFIDQGRLATSSDDETVRFWSPNGDEVSSSHTGVVTRVARYGDSIVTAGVDGRVIRLSPGLDDELLHAGDSEVLTIDGTRNGELYSFGTANGEFFLNRDLLAQTRGSIEVVRISENLRWVASGSSRGEVLVLDRTAGKLRHHQFGEHKIRDLQFSGSGQLALGSSDGAVRVLDLVDATLVTFVGHRGRVSSVAFGPTGQLVSSGFDGTIRNWELASGTRIDLDKGKTLETLSHLTDVTIHGDESTH